MSSSFGPTISFLHQRLSARTLAPFRSVTASVLSMCGSLVIRSTAYLSHLCVQNYYSHFFFFFSWCLLVVYSPIVLTGQGLFSHNVQRDCFTPWINIYSEPRSVVINRKVAGEIILSIIYYPWSPQPLYQSQVSWSSYGDVSFAHVCTVCVICVHEYVCICMGVCGCGNVGRSPTQNKWVDKCYNVIIAGQ